MRRATRRLLVAAGLAAVLAAGATVLWVVRGRVGHGVMEILRGVRERPAPADVANPRRLAHARYAVSVPGNWRLDEGAPGHDPEARADINAPARGKVVLTLLPKAAVPAFWASYRARTDVMVSRARVTPFASWGEYSGTGLEVSGRLAVSAGRIRLFTHEGEDLAFGVVEIRWDEHEVENAPGFRLVESSFRLH